MPSHLNRMEVDVGEHSIALNAELLQKNDQRLERVETQDLILDPDEHRHCKVEDEILVSLEQEYFPDLVEEAELDDSRIKRSDEPRAVHFNLDMLALQMIGNLTVCILKQKICDSQCAAQIRQLVLAAIELIVQVVWNKALDESLKKGVDAGQVELRFLLISDLAYPIAETLNRPRRRKSRWIQNIPFLRVLSSW